MLALCASENHGCVETFYMFNLYVSIFYCTVQCCDNVALKLLLGLGAKNTFGSGEGEGVRSCCAAGFVATNSDGKCPHVNISFSPGKCTDVLLKWSGFVVVAEKSDWSSLKQWSSDVDVIRMTCTNCLYKQMYPCFAETYKTDFLFCRLAEII